jgi:acyl-CoA synthetase (NDP forming)/RimJ/RimL family protein N-acetyltransferase
MATTAPSHWETDVVLADGGTVHVRPIHPDDRDRLVDLHSRLSDRTIYYRFFSPHPRLTPREVERFTTVDHEDRVALVALLDDRFVAVARYDRTPGTTEAEVAFVVADEHQGRGVATLLLEHLAAAARERGITRFFAETLPDNRAMQGVFKAAGWKSAARWADGLVHVEFPIDPTPESLAAQAAREQRADARSVARLLQPTSVAVVGASRDPSSIGHAVFRNLLDGGFSGPVYPVNREAASVASVAAWPSLADVPDVVDLVVIATPAAEVPDVVEQCVARRVGGIVIISTGFAETGPEGLAAERAIVERARGAGMRVVGPGSMGIVNTDPAVGLSAVIGGTPVLPGRVGILSQSGALGVGLLRWASRIGLGVSSFVAVGNKADVSGNDALQHWDEDERTDVVLLYLESFGNPRKFARVARRVANRKPVLAVRAGDDPTVEALFRQTGVLRVDSVERLFEAASVLATQPLPSGRSVAVVASSGGPALLAAAALQAAGLEVGSTIEIALDAPIEHLTDAIEGAKRDSDAHAVVVILSDAIATDIVTPSTDKPVVVIVLEPDAGVAPSAVPTFRSPEGAALALATAARYAEQRAEHHEPPQELDGIDVVAARLLVERALESDRDEDVTAPLLDAFGIHDACTVVGTAELVVTVRQDPTFGPVIGVEVGGPSAALIGDRSVRITPLSARDASDLVRSLRTAPVLFHGVDTAPLEDLLLRVSRLVDDVPEIDVLSVSPHGSRIHLAPWGPRPDLALRRLS